MSNPEHTPSDMSPEERMREDLRKAADAAGGDFEKLAQLSKDITDTYEKTYGAPTTTPKAPSIETPQTTKPTEAAPQKNARIQDNFQKLQSLTNLESVKQQFEARKKRLNKNSTKEPASSTSQSIQQNTIHALNQVVNEIENKKNQLPNVGTERMVAARTVKDYTDRLVELEQQGADPVRIEKMRKHIETLKTMHSIQTPETEPTAGPVITPSISKPSLDTFATANNLDSEKGKAYIEQQDLHITRGPKQLLGSELYRQGKITAQEFLGKNTEHPLRSENEYGFNLTPELFTEEELVKLANEKAALYLDTQEEPTVEQTPSSPEKTPAALVAEAREKYLEEYEKSFKNKSSFTRSILNFTHASGILRKDKSLSKEARAAKDTYEQLKNNLEEDMRTRLEKQNKSPEQIEKIMKRYRDVATGLEQIEKESGILNKARAEAFAVEGNKNLALVYNKTLGWYSKKFTPQQRKAISLGIAVGAGFMTGGMSTAMVGAMRVVGGALGGKIAEKVGNALWKQGAGGSYEKRLEQLKKDYMAGTITPSEYQQRKEGLELLNNRAEALKTTGVLAAGFGSAAGIGQIPDTAIESFIGSVGTAKETLQGAAPIVENFFDQQEALPSTATPEPLTPIAENTGDLKIVEEVYDSPAPTTEANTIEEVSSSNVNNTLDSNKTSVTTQEDTILGLTPELETDDSILNLTSENKEIETTPIDIESAVVDNEPNENDILGITPQEDVYPAEIEELVQESLDETLPIEPTTDLQETETATEQSYTEKPLEESLASTPDPTQENVVDIPRTDPETLFIDEDLDEQTESETGSESSRIVITPEQEYNRMVQELTVKNSNLWNDWFRTKLDAAEFIKAETSGITPEYQPLHSELKGLVTKFKIPVPPGTTMENLMKTATSVMIDNLNK